MAEVVLVRWPEEGMDGVRLADDGVPVLYLIGPDAEAPVLTSCLEDWVRVPGEDRDIAARVAALELRAAAHDAPPRVDGRGRLHFRGRVVVLAPAEARLAGVLVDHFGEVVGDRELSAAAESGDMPAAPLRTRVGQLRSQVRDMGLSVHRIPRSGYRLRAM